MPTNEIHGLIQRAALWTFSGTYDGDGEPTVDPPIEIRCRWEPSTRQLLSADGSPIQVDAEVMVPIDISVGSILRLGGLVELTATLDNLYEVLSFDSTPDLKGRSFQRNVSVRKINRPLTLAS